MERGMPEQERCFQGRWITSPLFAAAQPLNVFHRQLEPCPLPQGLPQNKHILFRKTCRLNAFREAILYITADDYYKLYVNGCFVTQGPSPGYPFHYYYNKIDLTAYLHPGENTLAVHTYYQGLINRVWVSGDCRHGLLLDLLIDGKTVVKSDTSFRCQEHSGFSALGKFGYDTQFAEQYDSRAKEVGFEAPDFDDSSWPLALERKQVDYRVFSQPTPNLVLEKKRPIRLLPTETGYFADFGSQYCGTVTLQAKGAPGSVVRIRCGQECQPDGTVRYQTRSNCCYEDTWILSGKTDQLNQYDYKAFRYLELLLPPGCRIQEDSIALLERHSPFTLRAACQVRDPRLKQIWDLCVHSLEYGLQEVIQDCLDREKGQYLGDGCFTTTAYSILTGSTAMMEKFIDEFLRSAFINNGLVTCAPCSFMQEIAEYSLMLPMLLRVHFHLTGDLEFLRKRYHRLVELLEFYRISYEAENGLLTNLDKWCVVEWPPHARDDYDADLQEGRLCRDVHNVINAYYLGAIKTVNQLAAFLEVPPYRDSQTLTQVFQKTFYMPEQGLFRDRVGSNHISLPGNAFALLYDLCPDQKTEQNIVAMIRKKKLSASMFFVTFAMLMGLKRLGENDLCLELLADEGGWLRMLREDATVTMEGWGKEVKWNTSLFHLAFTYPILFLTDWDLDSLLRGAIRRKQEYPTR